jgi:molybdenum-dependent DNA-binding transcriptional regulator ModE
MTLYSLSACAHRMMGHSSGRTTSLELFGTPTSGLRHDFPSNLHEFCRRTDGQYGAPIDIAQKATCLPYFVRFRPTAIADDLVEIMTSSNADRLKFCLGMHASPTGASFPLRACTFCMGNDEKEYGVAYWHRCHQLPGVYRCRIHDAPLQESPLRIDRRRRSIFLLPRDYGIFSPTQRGRISDTSNTILSRLAVLSSNVLEHPLTKEYAPSQLTATYAHGLRDLGLLTKGGNVRCRDFLKWIRDTYCCITEYPPYDWILRDQHLDGLLRLVRKPRADFHTAYHVLLIDALFGSWERFGEVYAWEGTMNPSVARNPKSETPVPSFVDPRLLPLVQRVQERAGSLTTLCKELGIDYQTAVRHLAASGKISIDRRPKVLTAEVRKSVVNSLRTGEAQRNVAKRHGLSRATIDRICQETTDLHQEWANANLEFKRQSKRGQLLAHLSRHPGTTRNEAITSHAPGYGWLQRHDAQWLALQMPRSPSKRTQPIGPRTQRVNWDQRDMECLEALKALRPKLSLEPNERRQPAVVLRKLPRLSFTPRLDRLPKSSEFVAKILASIVVDRTA